MKYNDVKLLLQLAKIQEAVENFKETLENGDLIDDAVDEMWDYILEGEKQ